MVQLLWQIVWQFLRVLNRVNKSHLFTPMYVPKGIKSMCLHKNICKVTTELFTTIPKWKPPVCPLTGE